MTWTELNNYDFRGIDGAHYWVIDQFSNPGKLWVYIPEFSASRDGRLILGVADVPSRSKRPAYVGAKVIRIVDYGQYHFFDVPSLENPCLGIRRERASSDGTLANFISGVRPRIEMSLITPVVNEGLPVLTVVPVQDASFRAKNPNGFILAHNNDHIQAIEDPANPGTFLWLGREREQRIEYKAYHSSDIANDSTNLGPTIRWAPLAQNDFFTAMYVANATGNPAAKFKGYFEASHTWDDTTLANNTLTSKTKIEITPGTPQTVDQLLFRVISDTVSQVLSVEIQYRPIYIAGATE